MTMTREQIARLPKAALVTFRIVRPSRWPRDYRTCSPFFIRWRNANARGFMFGNLMVIIRAPWLERAARHLHPDAFAEGKANA